MTRPNLARHALIVALVILAVCPLARADCPEREITVCEAFLGSDKVFQGRILEATTVLNPDEAEALPEEFRYKLRVERSFRGNTGKFETVIARQNAFDAWGDGMHALVFSRKGTMGESCTPIIAIERSGEVMAQIAVIANTPRSYLTPAECPRLPTG